MRQYNLNRSHTQDELQKAKADIEKKDDLIKQLYVSTRAPDELDGFAARSFVG